MHFARNLQIWGCTQNAFQMGRELGPLEPVHAWEMWGGLRWESQKEMSIPEEHTRLPLSFLELPLLGL